MNKSTGDISLSLSPEVDRLLEEVRRQRNAGGLEFIGKLRPDAGGCEGPEGAPVRSNALLLEHEHILHADDVVFHPGNLGNMRNTPGAIVETRHLHDDGNR